MADTKNKKAGTGSAKKESFWSGVKREWKKIIWLKREDIVKQTGLVVVMSLLMGVIISAVDSVALRLVNWFLAL